MQLDPEHVRKLDRALAGHAGSNQRAEVKIDIAFLRVALDRLSVWEGGLLFDSLMRAATARRLSREQRALLALFVHDEQVAPGAEEACHVDR